MLDSLGRRSWNKGKKGLQVAWNKGKKGLQHHSKETRKKLSDLHKGKHRSPKTEFKKGLKHTEEWKEEMSKKTKGKNNPCWRGGKTKTNALIRSSKEYSLWRKSVFERDDYTCVWCGIKSIKGKRVIIHADHIKPFAFFPELRFAIDNGRTLCVECHRKTETYQCKVNKFN